MYVTTIRLPDRRNVWANWAVARWPTSLGDLRINQTWSHCVSTHSKKWNECTV